MAFTVVPLRHLRLPLGTKISFAPDFFLEDIPPWVKEDKGILADLSLNEREAILDGRHAFVSQYDAGSIGQPDLDWPKESRRSIQKSKSENAILANLELSGCNTHRLSPLLPFFTRYRSFKASNHNNFLCSAFLMIFPAI